MTTQLNHSLSQVLLQKEKDAGETIYLRQPRQGVWQEYTWAEVMLQARKVAAFLGSQGLKRGSHISIISKNCAEWFITDFGICLAGMVNVPLFHNQHEESIHYVLEHGDVQLVFVGKLDDHQTVRQFVPKQYKTVGFDYHPDLHVDYSWKDILNTPALVDVVPAEPDDLYTIIYSSGTTGAPKGAMYTHQSIARYLELFAKDIVRIRDLPHYKLISYLPLAHVYERSAIELGSLMINAEISFIESLDKFAENLKEIQPTFFTAVPRIWGVFQQKIEYKLPTSRLNLLLKIPLISSLIKKKIRAQLGFSNCVNFFSGASQLPVSIMEYFDKLGICIQEGYGQTENLAYATLSYLPDRKKGCVGTVRYDVEIKVAEDQELLVKSACLMSGFYKNPDASKASFTDEGWLKTGDIVEMDAHGRVKVLGRISENFKNQSGEFVAPTPIEKLFTVNTDIEQLCLVGRGLPSNVLLVVLSDTAKVRKSKTVIRNELQHLLGKVNAHLTKYEKISHILITKETWTPTNNMLTPTLKVKRRKVEEIYQPWIEKILSERSAVVWEE